MIGREVAPPVRAEGHTPAGSLDIRMVTGRLVVAGLVLALGSLALQGAWLSPVVWLPLFLVAFAGLGGVWVLQRAGTNPGVTAMAAFAVPLSLVAVLGRDEGDSAWEGMINALPTLLTSPYPAPATLSLLAPGLAIAWSAGAVAGAGLSRRTYIVTPLVAGLLLLVAADLLTAGGSDRYGLIGLGLIAVLLAHWSGWATRGRRGLPPASGLALLFAVFTLLIGYLPLGQPFQPRDLVRSPTTSVAEPNPLPLLGHWARHPDEEILRRTGNDYPVHLVVLPDYDGVSFNSNSEYVPAGGTEQPVLPPGRFRRMVETAITWESTSRWLPAPGVPVEVSVPDVLIDVDTGSLITPEVPRGGIVSYTVRGQVDAPRIAEVAAADVGRHPRYTALPEIPPEFAGYAREVTRNADTYLQQAQALERAVKGGRAFDPDAPGGSSYGRLQQFLFGLADHGGRRGTSEQFASAYAVLARSVGLPTRVVVGFGAGTPLATDSPTNVVRGRDALAWPEIYFQDFGWVPFNPTPDVHNVDTPASAPPGPGESLESFSQDPTSAAPPSSGTLPPARHWWLIPLGVLISLGGSATGLGLARRSRASRQREQGAIGAWLKVEDALVLSGRPTAMTLSAPQRALALGVSGARHVAVAAETAAFAPERFGDAAPPDGDGDHDRADTGDSNGTAESNNGTAESNWGAAGRVERALRADASWWRRWLWPISPAVWWGRPKS